jgi:8-oxo-dGTP pyrophosphatase MutT (NUDIX family)
MSVTSNKRVLRAALPPLSLLNMNDALSLRLVQQALALTPPAFDVEAAQQRLAPSLRPRQREARKAGQARLAATLLLLYLHEDNLHFVLTRRPDTLKNHGGQISLPGGRKEEGETFDEAALREAREELGIEAPIQLLGALTSLYIPPSDFQVYPFVGYLPERPTWRHNPSEVAEVIECPLVCLFDDSLKQWEKGEWNGHTFTYGFYALQGHRVWGATAITLSEFEGRLRVCLGGDQTSLEDQQKPTPYRSGEEQA